VAAMRENEDRRGRTGGQDEDAGGNLLAEIYDTAATAWASSATVQAARLAREQSALAIVIRALVEALPDERSVWVQGALDGLADAWNQIASEREALSEMAT